MSQNPDIIVFTPDGLAKHDLKIAAFIHQATVLSTLRKAASMNAGQLVQACSNGGSNLYWPQERLEKLLNAVDLEDKP